MDKKNSIHISAFGYENKKNKHSIYVSKQCYEKNHDLLLIGERKKNTMILSNISIHSRMIIHYTVEKNIFIVIVYTCSLQKKY